MRLGRAPCASLLLAGVDMATSGSSGGDEAVVMDHIARYCDITQ
jgi:hypothetical protein